MTTMYVYLHMSKENSTCSKEQDIKIAQRTCIQCICTEATCTHIILTLLKAAQNHTFSI